MKKTIILFAGSIAESVTSAAIQAVASPGPLCIDIEKETFKFNELNLFLQRKKTTDVGFYWFGRDASMKKQGHV